MWAAFDIETTGLSPQGDRIIELAICRDGEVKSWLINPGVPIPEEITGITGITPEMIQQYGIFFSDAWEWFLAEALGCEFLVGHNAVRFDWPFVVAELYRLGTRSGLEFGRGIRDTAAIFKARAMGWADPKTPGQALDVLEERVYGLPYNLRHAANEMGLTVPDGLHRAGADAKLTWELYRVLMGRK